MSAHRRHYLDLNLGPEADPRHVGDAGGAARYAPSWLLVVLALALLLVQLAALLWWPQPDQVVTPVRIPVRQTYELPDVSVEDARVEGFRAGYAAATEQGCHAPMLATPIGGTR